MGEAAYPLETRGSRLIDESRYAAPALQRYQILALITWFLRTNYQSKVVPNPPVKLASLGEDGNGHGPRDEDGQGLNGMDHVLRALIVMRERDHGR